MTNSKYPPNQGQSDINNASDLGDIPLTGDDLNYVQDDIQDQIAAIQAEQDKAAQMKQGDGTIESLLAEKDDAYADLNDKFLRLAAEMENMRRRGEREKKDAGRYAIAELARELVTVADHFDLALRTVPENNDEITLDMVAGLVTGLRMTEKELLTVLQRYNVVRIFPAGERFDPNLHQAVAQVPGNGIPQGFVVDVAQPGFTIGDRVLRAAMVTVSLGGDPTPPETEQDAASSTEDNIEDNGENGQNLDTKL